MKNIPIDFFAQLFVRVFMKTPKFFNIVKVVAVALAVFSGALAALPDEIAVNYPILAAIDEITVLVSSLVAAMIAQMTIETSSTPTLK